jgi:hypothetical protein
MAACWEVFWAASKGYGRPFTPGPATHPTSTPSPLVAFIPAVPEEPGFIFGFFFFWQPMLTDPRIRRRNYAKPATPGFLD